MIYVEEISFLSLFTLVNRCFIYRSNYLKWPKIIYIDASELGQLIVKLFHKLGYPVEKLNFFLRDIRDSEGELLRLRIHREDLFKIKKEIESMDLIKNVSKSLDEFQKTYLLKGMTCHPLTESSSASRVLFLIGVIEWHIKKGSQEKVFFLIRNRPWFHLYFDYAGKKSINLISYKCLLSFKNKDNYSNKFNLIPILYIFLRAIKSIKCISFFPPAVSSIARIFVEGRRDINFTNNGHHSDFFWMQVGKISSNSLVYVSANSLERQTLKFNSVNPAVYCMAQIFSCLFSTKKIFTFFSRGIYSKESRLIARILRSYKCAYWYWRGLFVSNNIKVFLTWYRYETQHIAISSAIRDIGGVSVYLPAAFDGWENIEGLTRSDVTFCYSNFGSLVEEKCQSYSEYKIVVGYPRDYATELLKPHALNIRTKLIKNGAKKIIFVIDENSGDDERWHTGHELQRENYKFALEAILDNDWLGVVFKPKVAKTLYARLGPVYELFDKAMLTGRCYIYDEKSIDLTSVPPLLAGLSADLCIHGHLSGGTAALECALAGLPTLLIDREGVPKSKLRELPMGKVVFEDWKTAINLALKYLSCTEVDKEFGSWEKILSELDPYRDGMASIRIGSYLNSLLKGFESGLSRTQALENAATLFAAQWGSDKVIRGR